jgi:hypothetical protein
MVSAVSVPVAGAFDTSWPVPPEQAIRATLRNAQTSVFIERCIAVCIRTVAD